MLEVLDEQHPDAGVIVVYGSESPPRMLAHRPARPGGSAKLVVLADGPKRGPLQFPDRPKRDLAADARLQIERHDDPREQPPGIAPRRPPRRPDTLNDQTQLFRADVVPEPDDRKPERARVRPEDQPEPDRTPRDNLSWLRAATEAEGLDRDPRSE